MAEEKKEAAPGAIHWKPGKKFKHKILKVYPFVLLPNGYIVISFGFLWLNCLEVRLFDCSIATCLDCHRNKN